jgi:hypothetical protein
MPRAMAVTDWLGIGIAFPTDQLSTTDFGQGVGERA